MSVLVHLAMIRVADLAKDTNEKIQEKVFFNFILLDSLLPKF